MKAYSTDLRQKIIAAYEKGAGTLDEIADTFSIAHRSLASYLLRVIVILRRQFADTEAEYRRVVLIMMRSTMYAIVSGRGQEP
jgi:hypothetical protein